MTPPLNHQALHQTTTRFSVSVSGVSSVAMALVKTLLSPREVFLNHRESTVAGVVQWRKDVRGGKIRLFHQLLKSNCADIDDGAPIEAVNQYLRDAIEFNEQYAARKARRDAAGVLPFVDRLMRAAVSETQAEGVANVATQIAECRPTDLTALRNARSKIQAEIEPKTRLVEVITSQIVALETQAAR